MARRKKAPSPEAFVEFMELDWIVLDPENPKGHDIPEIKASIKRFGFITPLLWNEKDGRLIAGHGRHEALSEMKADGEPMPSGLRDGWLVPVIRGLSFKDRNEAKAYLVADNRLVELGGWSTEGLANILEEVRSNTEMALQGVGYTPEDLELMLNGHPPTEETDEKNSIDVQVNHGALSTRFLVPPFSVLSAREGWWRDRKRLWLSLGIKSEVGRAGLGDTAMATRYDFFNDGELLAGDSGSVFDPVLCELAYTWFCPPAGKVFDPFAGGSVRGVLAAKLGRSYHGVELRTEQVEANRLQWEEIGNRPVLEETKPASDNTPELSPVQKHGGYLVKRDDLFCVAGVRGGKARTCWHLAQGSKGLVTAGSRSSPQVNIVSHIAKRLGVPCRVHTPNGDLSPEVQAAQDQGAEVIQHKAGYNSVIMSRAKEDAKAQGYTEIPFGMECKEAVSQTRKQIANLPFGKFGRIVVPVGSGMTLSGILWGLKDAGQDVPVLGVVVGASPEKRLDKFAPKNWRDMVSLVPAGVDYHERVEATVGDLVVDAHYEAKAVSHLRKGDLFWVVGIRQTQADIVLHPEPLKVEPYWEQGDSTKVKIPAKPDADMVFSCPPYADLEKYSDDPQDLSNMPYPEFLKAYREVIRRAVARLKTNRFAVWVVGDVRDPDGNYRNLVGDTVEAFRDAGASLYNEAILVTPAGTLPLRAGRQFAGGRKLGKTHQNVLVFVKGDGKKASKVCGEVVVHVPGEQPAGEPAKGTIDENSLDS